MMGLKMLFDSMGLKIDPEELQALYEKIKVQAPELLPQILAKFESIDARLARIEAALESARHGIAESANA